MSRWFRHYAGMMRDDKLVRVAIRSRQTIERVVWVYGAILESATEIDDGGRFDFDSDEAAYFLRADTSDVDSILAALAVAGRIAEDRVVKWGERQFHSDKSKDRQAAYRERKRAESLRSDTDEPQSDGGVTSPERHRDVPETETETELETENTPLVPLTGGEPDLVQNEREEAVKSCIRKAFSIHRPDWLPDSFDEFKAMRRAMRNVPFKEGAEKRCIDKLTELRAQGHDPEKLISKAIENGHRTFFPDETTKATSQKLSRDEQISNIKKSIEFYSKHGRQDEVRECRRRLEQIEGGQGPPFAANVSSLVKRVGGRV